MWVRQYTLLGELTVPFREGGGAMLTRGGSALACLVIFNNVTTDKSKIALGLLVCRFITEEIAKNKLSAIHDFSVFQHFSVDFGSVRVS